MNQQEREVIGTIFQRLEQAANQPRDPEAERFIADRVRAQPYAPYAMAQSIYVQEQALANLNARVEQLSAELDSARRGASGGNSGGFLSGLFGGGQREPDPRTSYGAQGGQAPAGGPWAQQGGGAMAPQPGPWGQRGDPQGQPGGFGAPQQQRGSGFLGTALTTAAGVAGGMLVGSALANAFGGAGDAAKQGLGALGGGDQASASGNTDHSQFSPFGNNSTDKGGGEQNAANNEDQGGGYDDGGDFGGDEY